MENIKSKQVVLGFDVGIKNLSYCIVHKEDDKFVIDDHTKNWNIINLTEQTTLKCCYKPDLTIDTKKKKKKVLNLTEQLEEPINLNQECSNQICSFIIVNNVQYNFCSKHKSYHKVIHLLNPIICTEIQSNDKCSHTESCKTKSKWCYNDKLYCLKHKEINMKKIEKERTITKYKTFVKDFTIHDLKLILLQKLDTFKDIFLQCNIVCIENQPAFKNPTMKAISDVLYTWFMIRGLIEKDITGSTISKITFFAPSNKLNIADKKDDIADEIENAGNKYKKTKELGISNCIEMIKYNQEYVDYLNSFKKKDDLCDAFLHAVHYIEKNFEPKVKTTKKIFKKTTKEIDLIDDLTDNDIIETNLIKPKKTKKIKSNII